ncbi:XylR N-terminal domain-containing protein [Bacillus massiliigorillae]|uniref:XylR N-terminal domain-containing protein n=1 Tax=Bacillus massiliigorillae TaxID=1243664 RepID=UPI00039D180E|nr:XylR N-terminal domain-containing protein [Bacillus massiliigorillae]
MSANFQLVRDEGKIYFDNERIILTSSSIFGALRKDLVENLGIERTKGFLLRYGWNLGMNDAKKVLQQEHTSIQQLLRQGPIMHRMQGYTDVQTTVLEINTNEDGSIQAVIVKGIWKNSYEAEEHLLQMGISNHSVCHTLIGYASGYYSTICGHEVIFKETSCKAVGASVCQYEGKSISLWDRQIDEERKYYKPLPIVQELEVTYERLLEEKNNLSQVTAIHSKLTEQLMNGRNLQSIARTMFQLTHIPIIIENVYNEDFLHVGVDKDVVDNIRIKLKEIVHHNNKKDESLHSQVYEEEQFRLLYTPIVLQQRTWGYCAFVIMKELEDNKEFTEINKMVLERISTVCSLYILNEKNSFEALERVKGLFLEQILNKEIHSEGEIIKKSRYLDSPLEEPYFMLVIDYKKQRKQANENDYFIQQQMMESIFHFFKNNHIIVLTAQKEGNIVLLITDRNHQIRHSRMNLSHDIFAYLQSSFQGLQFKFGLSSVAEKVESVFDMYQQALTALLMNKGITNITAFDELDVMGILMHSGNNQMVLQKAKNTLEPLLKPKEPKMEELLKTLYVFLQCGGNLEKIMEEMSISMSGLRYRLKRIEELLGIEIRQPNNSFQLYASLEALIIAKEINLDD